MTDRFRFVGMSVIPEDIDYVIDIAEEELTEDIIKLLHYILKHDDTKDSSLSWLAVGDYKKRANVVGGRETTKPADVHFDYNC